ncbi:Uncharacterised protein [Clostridioides difficile]|nr:Uncharacterised protein [Clostridioides difficile]
MYSHPCAPTPSTTAVAPEFLTQNLSPAIPFINTLPDVAPYKATFPISIFSSAMKVDFFDGYTISLPPDNPFPK